MYWQKRFDRIDPNKKLEEKILAIHNEHKDFGYRRMQAILRKEGINVNKKKVQRIMQKLDIQVTSYTRKIRRYNSYKGVSISVEFLFYAFNAASSSSMIVGSIEIKY